MEIFKLFSPEWSVGTTPRTSKCENCDVLSKQLEDKHDVLITLINKGNDVQKQLQEVQEKEMEMQMDLDQMKNNNQEFLPVLDEYDKIVETLINDRKSLKSSSDITAKHLTNLEFSFSDVHSKYERAKLILEGYKENEMMLKESIKENEKTIEDLNNRCEQLKDDATKKLEEANATIHNLEEKHKEEIKKYQTRIKMLEITVSSLESTLSQKVQENLKLSSICDEFINKV